MEANSKFTSTLKEDSENSMQLIYKLRQEIKKQKKEMQLERDTHLKVKRDLFDDFKKEKDKTEKKFKRFKSLA